MLHNLYHTEDIDQCVPVYSTIRILSDMRMRVFVAVLTWKSLLAHSILSIKLLIPNRQFGNSFRPIYNVIRLKLFSICK